MILKQPYKLWIALVCALFIITNLVFPLEKASAEVMDHTKYQMDWSYSKSLNKPVRTELIKTADGQIAYCLSVHLKSPSGQDLPEIGKTDVEVYRVLLNGYPQKSPQELGVSTWEEAHYATQLAVWNALKQIDINDLEHRNKNVGKAMAEIVARAQSSQEVQEITMSVTPLEKQTATLKNDFFKTDLYTVETNATKGTYQVQATNAPEGVKFVNENGEAKTQFSVGGKFRILIPKATKKGEFSFKVVANLSKLQAIKYKGTTAIQDAAVLLERGEEKTSSDLLVNWEATSSSKYKK
ncbi:TPA: thioester domain-containing protein [Bacillus pseudomycoides]|nr:thioester domain-containing protein [Bacillus pseudomycoides]